MPRSNAGLYYQHSGEFDAVLDRLLDDSPSRLGSANTAARSLRSLQLAGDRTEILNMFEELKSEPPTREMEPTPGWLARHRADVPPAIDVVAGFRLVRCIDDVGTRMPSNASAGRAYEARV